MKYLIDLGKGIKDSPELRKIAMDMAQFMFTKSQENLLKPMPWGDEKYRSDKKDTTISNNGDILKSGVPPYWEGDNKIVFRYDTPISFYVEYGTPPHMPPVEPIVEWAEKKLRKGKKDAQSIGWAVAMTIKKEGMPPHPFVRPAIDSARIKYGLNIKGL